MPEKSETLEELLRKRLADTRAMVGALSINANRLFLTFGAVGDNKRVTLRVVGDQIGDPASFEVPAGEITEAERDGQSGEPQTAEGESDGRSDAPATDPPSPQGTTEAGQRQPTAGKPARKKRSKEA